MTAKTWTAAAKAGLMAVAVIALGAPVGQLLAQQTAPAPSADAAAPADQARIAKGRELFAGWSCTSCHSLADAGSHGDVGPHLDGGQLSEGFIVNRVTNGQGAMPSFGGQLTEQEIADVAYYIAHVAKK